MPAVREDAPSAVRAFQRGMRNVASEPKSPTARPAGMAACVFSRRFRLIPVTGFGLPDAGGGNEAVRHT